MGFLSLPVVPSSVELKSRSLDRSISGVGLMNNCFQELVIKKFGGLRLDLTYDLRLTRAGTSTKWTAHVA